MCFRPTEISAPQICPQCGKKIQVLDGVKQALCPFCKAPMDDTQSGAPEAAAPGIGAPKPPAAPGAAGAPKPPTPGPGAPKPPTPGQ